MKELQRKEFLGIDIGGTFLKYAIIDEAMNITKKWKKPTIRFEQKDDFYDYVCQDISLLGQNNVSLIGVSAPGIIDHQSNVLSFAADNVKIMYGTNVNEEIVLRTKRFVSTMNDAKAAGYCEFCYGNGKGTRKSIYYLIGTGIGGCVCDENGVVDGNDYVVGEFSYLPIGYDDKGNYVMHTSNASMDALIQQYNEVISKERAVVYGADVIRQHLQGEVEANQAVDQWLDHICFGLIALTTMYNPEVICIGGGISEELWFIEALQQRYQQRCRIHFRGDVISTRIDRCHYGNDANLIGAVANARQKQGEQ